KLPLHHHQPPGAWLKPESRLRETFARAPEAMDNSCQIADLCHDDYEASSWRLPSAEVPEGETPESHLATLAWEGFAGHYDGSPDLAQAKEIQSKELRVIGQTGYSGYFLTVREIHRHACRLLTRGYRRATDCMVLRGSAANCMTLYNLGVSQLDPVQHGLYFERFLNPDRKSPPDADMDFGWDERGAIIDWISRHYGADHVAMLGTTHRFRSKGALRESCRALGLALEDIQALKRRLRKGAPDARASVEEAMRTWPALGQAMELAQSLTGRPHFIGQHCGGVFITDDPVWRHVSCQHSAEGRGRVVSQIDMHSGTDFLGLVKFDILGNGSLSVVRDVLEQLEAQGHPDPELGDMERIQSDPKVQAMMREGGSRGVFYIESPAQTRLNRKSGAQTLEEIGITSSLVRPAGTAYAKTFVERHRKASQGVFDWEWLHPSLAPILSQSHDVCAFQEDITRICVEIAGLSFAQADKVRKMMNSQHEGIPDGWEQLKTDFVQGCQDTKGFLEDQALELWERVASFQGFSFCKSHSLSYAQLSFRSAWLKAHYPAQFWAAILQNRHGYYSPSVYLREARIDGLSLTSGGVEELHPGWWGDGTRLVPGLSLVKGLSPQGMEALLEDHRRHGPWSSLREGFRRLPRLDLKDLERFARAGHLDAFTLARSSVRPLWQEWKDTPHGSLPDLFGRTAPHQAPVPDSLAQKCRDEWETLGFFLSADPLELLSHHPASRDTVPLGKLGKHEGTRVRVLGFPAASREHPVASGKSMLFLSLQDASGMGDVVVWPDRLAHFHDRHQDGLIEVEGIVTQDMGTWSLEAKRIRIHAWSVEHLEFALARHRKAKAADAKTATTARIPVQPLAMTA
ncbi:MAG: polymerase alpha subunit, partial [Fibrobacterota bacterium]